MHSDVLDVQDIGIDWNILAKMSFPANTTQAQRYGPLRKFFQAHHDCSTALAAYDCDDFREKDRLSVIRDFVRLASNVHIDLLTH